MPPRLGLEKTELSGPKMGLFLVQIVSSRLKSLLLTPEWPFLDPKSPSLTPKSPFLTPKSLLLTPKLPFLVPKSCWTPKASLFAPKIVTSGPQSVIRSPQITFCDPKIPLFIPKSETRHFRCVARVAVFHFRPVAKENQPHFRPWRVLRQVPLRFRSGRSVAMEKSSHFRFFCALLWAAVPHFRRVAMEMSFYFQSSLLERC